MIERTLRAYLEAMSDEMRTKWLQDDELDRHPTIQAHIVRGLRNGWGVNRIARDMREEFGRERAKALAWTELKKAYCMSILRSLAKEGFTYTRVLDGEGCLPDGHDDRAPKPSGRAGVVEYDAQANGQIWTLDQAEQLLGGHECCVRSFSYSVGDRSSK